MNMIEEVKAIVTKLDEIEKYNLSLSQQLSIIESKQQDLLHYIENNKINTFGCYKIVKELKDIRQKRRKIKNDIELMLTYNENKGVLASEKSRNSLIQKIVEAEKSLPTKYQNRCYSKEELENIVK